jgi:uncharacterized damage-inducible protein DinB
LEILMKHAPWFALLLFAVPAAAQSRPDSTRMLLNGGFAEVSGWITRAAEMVPAERYTYRPVATVRTFGEMVAHVVDGYAWYCGSATGREVPWSDATEKGRTDKATLMARLKAATDACTAVYANGRVMPLMQNIGHANLHYGNLVTYLRMMGLTPPSS